VHDADGLPFRELQSSLQEFTDTNQNLESNLSIYKFIRSLAGAR
jgi:hypothetical protein